MVMATFRFYGRLNYFLPCKNRYKPLYLTCAKASTTKHMIEAIGIPHTEVAFLFLYSQPVGLNHLLGEGDELSIYPHDARIDRSCLDNSLLQPLNAVPKPFNFIADAHLGGLACLLRMAGFDTLYDNHFADSTIEQIAMCEGRIVLSRDRELLKRRGIRYGAYIYSLENVQQLEELTHRFNLSKHMHPFSLCLKCNAPLEMIEKTAIEDRLPPLVRHTQTHFSYCPVCLNIYWKGTHWESMNAFLNKLSFSNHL